MSTKQQKADPRVKRTRQFIRDALIALIREKGFEKITVQDIAEHAMINRATFYLHYRDKYDLMQQNSDEILNELIENINSAPLDLAAFDFHSNQPHPSFVRLFEQIALHADFYQVLLGEHRIPSFTSRLTGVITEFVSKGLGMVAPDDQQLAVPREIVVKYTVGAFLGVILWWLENDMPYTAKHMAAKLMRLAIYGPYVDNPFAPGR